MLDCINNPKNLDTYFIISDQKIAFTELYTLALKMGGWLQENRVTCLAFCVPNGLINLLAYLGGWAADVTVMPINPRLKSSELTRILHQYHPSDFWVTAEKMDEQLTKTCQELDIQLFVVNDKFFQGDAFTQQPPLPHPQKTPKNSIIQFTSGTLGEYKGAMHSYQKCAAYAQLMAQDMRYQTDDCLLICLSLNHAMAFSYQLLPALYLGLSCVVLPSFEVEAALSAIETYSVTSISVLPTVAYFLAKEVLHSGKQYPSLTKIIIAGDALPLSMRQTIIAAFGCEPIVGIGMTECFGYCLNFNPKQKLGSSGLPVAGFSFRVVDEHYQDLPVGETGDILIQGSGLFTEYYQLPALTEASFHQGWFKTGDLGAIDSDGYLWFRGRRKHLIISGGSNIAPLEIEAAIYEHPDVLEAVVVGAPDPDYIEKGVAFITTTASSMLTEEGVKQFLVTRLADYKLPKHIYFLASLPKNATGKLDRATLAEDAKRRILPSVATHAHSDTLPGPMMMGICNLTHDSFTEVGKGQKSTSKCFQEIQNLVSAGAHIIDIGAESTSKDAKGLDDIEELQLLEIILDELANKQGLLKPFPLISIDTRKVSIMKELLQKYPFIWMINDVEASNLAEKAQLVAQYQVKYVLTHNLGVIGRTAYLSKETAIEDMVNFFKEKVALLKKYGVKASQIYLDVGFGYGKDSETTQIILQNLSNIKAQLGLRLLIGHSRKSSVIGVPQQANLAELDAATKKLSIWLAKNGADILRVHQIN